MIEYKEMDDFIKYHAKLYIQNPSLPITDHTIYNSLKQYNLTLEEIQSPNISNQLLKLEYDYSKANHLHVYEDSNQPNFLQFFHWTYNTNNISTVKLYIGIPQNQIYNASRIIFDFIEQNKINSLSKISNKMRSDAIVLRIEEKDAQKIINFINSNPELNKISRKTNPFTLKEGIVSLGYDDRLSYNSVISLYLSKYFQHLKNNNKLNEASIQGFTYFLVELYQNVFVNNIELKDFVDNNNVFEQDRFTSVGDAINNYEQVTRLIIKTLSNQLNLPNYLQFIKECNDNQLQQNNIQQFDNIYSLQSNKNYNEAKDLLDSYIIYALKKYSSIPIVTRYLSTFLNGKDIGITRDNNYRSKLCSVDKSILIQIVGDNINDYIQQVSIENNLQNNNINIQYFTFIEAIKETHKKYDIDHSFRALLASQQGNYDFITNDNNCRLKVMQNVNYKNIRKICLIYLIEKGYDINNIDNNEINTIFMKEINQELKNKSI